VTVSRSHSGLERGNNSRRATRGGFTLIEILTALLVMGVATTIFINLYSASVTLAETNRGQRLATSLAEEYMAHILNDPKNFNWSAVFEAESPTELARVADPSSVEIPVAIPTFRRSLRREENLYAEYTQEAWARLPAPVGITDANDGPESSVDPESSADPEMADPEYLELVVVIRWQRGGRNHFFSLTSTIPRERAKDAQST
jgi:prepilin-type N-terminal cleavage/methylation domain-containing protein